MKMKMQMSAVAAMMILASICAEAHQVQWKGKAGSTADLIAKSLIAQAGKIQGLVVEKQADGSTRVFAEDYEWALNCIQGADSTFCQEIEKHERPLNPDFTTYGVGNSMEIKGDMTTNAGLIAQIIKNAAASDSTIKAVEYMPNRWRLVREDDSLTLTCFILTAPKADESPAECDFRTE